MCNVAEANQNAYLVLILYHNPCLKRSDQSYILKSSLFCRLLPLLSISLLGCVWCCLAPQGNPKGYTRSPRSPDGNLFLAQGFSRGVGSQVVPHPSAGIREWVDLKDIGQVPDDHRLVIGSRH